MRKKTMKTILLLVGLTIGSSSYAQNTNYVVNKAPLVETPFTALPLGSVKAEGWILKQLELQKTGATGNAETLYAQNDNLGPGNNWLGGTTDSWERAPYYVKGLTALAYTLNDATLIERAKKWLDWSINSQQSNGFFGPSNNTDWWARMPMLYAIRDFYEATGDNRVLPFFTKYFQYQNATIDNRPLSSWGRSRAGDNIDVIFWLYNHTGDAFLLELADKLEKQAYDWTEIYTNNKFMSFGTDFQPKHNVNIPQAMKMPAIYYQKSKNEADKHAYCAGHEHLMRDHGQPVGMQSGNEMVSGRSAMTGMELCSIVEQMQTSETAQMILGDASIGDQLEKVAFNALPGSLSKDIKAHQYYAQANQVQSKKGGPHFSQSYDNGLLPSPYSGYGCCRYDFHMGWPYFVKNMWAATKDNGLAVMAYGPSEVKAKVANGVELMIKEETNYPFEEELLFTLGLAQATSFPLKFRIPEWCENPQIVVNGSATTNIVAGEFYEINREWNNNDKVVINFPMKIKIQEEVNNSVSVHRGPIVYSLKIEENWKVLADYGNGFKEYEVLPQSAWNYGLILDKNKPENSFEVTTVSMPDNPFVQGVTPISLKAKAKKIPEWKYAHNGLIACDPPYGSVTSNEQVEDVVLVPYGAENIRLTCIPVIGTPDYIEGRFTEDFNGGTQIGWVNYGGSFMVDNGEYLSTNIEGGQSGKSVYSATQFDDFTYNFKIKVGNKGDGGVLFRSSRLGFGADEYDGYYAGISVERRKIILGKANGGWSSLREIDADIAADTWYQMRVETKGSEIKIYVNNMSEPKITFFDTSFSKGSIGVRSYSAITRWDDLEITSSAMNLDEDEKDEFIIHSTRNYLDLEFGNRSFNNLTINIFNAAGALVVSKEYVQNESSIRIDTTSFSAGVYVVNLASEGNEYHSAKFIKEL